MKFDLFLIKRSIKHAYQRIFRGFSDAETWSLDYSFAKFILPRLVRLKEVKRGWPDCDEFPTFEDWNVALDKMIFAMKFCSSEEQWSFGYSPEEQKIEQEVQHGLELFGKYFRALYW